LKTDIDSGPQAVSTPVVHWHDTPLFERIRDARVAALKGTDDDEAEEICQHLAKSDRQDFYFMRAPISGRAWFLCRACCEADVELELLVLDDPPSGEAAQAPTAPAPSGAAIGLLDAREGAGASSVCR